MKHCPKCNRTFPDDMRFCLTDGGELASDAPSVDFGKTVVLAPQMYTPPEAPAPPVMPARDVASYPAPVQPAPVQPAPPPIQPPQPQRQPAPFTPQAAIAPQLRKTKKAPKASMIFGIISLFLTLLLGPIGVIGRMAVHLHVLMNRLSVSPELLGLVVVVPLPLISILFGAIGLFLAFRRPEKYGGKIIAPVGIVLSLFSIVIFAGFFLYGMSRFF